jgi:hypothetical protein
MAGFTIGATGWALEMSRRSVAFAFWINWALMGLAFVVWLMAPDQDNIWMFERR